METNTITLPDKLSELLQLALNDLRKCDNDSAYKIDMKKWHDPATVLKWYKPFSDPQRVCSVCLAGAVMAKTLHCSVEEEFTPSSAAESCFPGTDIVASGERYTLSRKLTALNHLRTGHIHCALWDLNIDIPEGLPEQVDVAHWTSKRRFYRGMEDLAVLLEQAGV